MLSNSLGNLAPFISSAITNFFLAFIFHRIICFRLDIFNCFRAFFRAYLLNLRFSFNLASDVSVKATHVTFSLMSALPVVVNTP